MVLVLCIGDFHVPHRALDIPPEFKKLLVPGKIHHILCTGNLCVKEVQDYLRGICPDLHVVRGDFDEFSSLPDNEVVSIGNFRIGLCNGYQIVPWGSMEALAKLQRQLDVDILVSGHTHEFKAYKHENRFLINPGSATGAYDCVRDRCSPSFVLMDINDSRAVVYIYELAEPDKKVKVDKVEFSKK
uniref:Vacuolar protein sorting-associated protein 29 n=1 Tax=Tetraselmis sp. GSL018 TaxID=582737 RepID=A0A061RC65_9CHLO|mmetsp:Transcript_11877/g.28213  ORF Transcript_11877/g.28213 Transcript_11877/m.28213 type:complete len:186 (+) Transcript_11877:84-641(+)